MLHQWHIQVHLAATKKGGIWWVELKKEVQLNDAYSPLSALCLVRIQQEDGHL